MPDSPFPDAPDDFDDSTELVKGWSSAVSRPPAARSIEDDDDDDGAGDWDDGEATAVVGATDIGGFFGERFRVDARLGIGAMGRVLTAVDMKTGTLVALKVLHKDRAKDPAVIERFQREAAVLREMRHPAIVRLVAFDRARDGTWWLAMEHLVGKTLKDRLTQGGPFTPRDAWPVLATVCDAVATAHAQGILHRDLKPENVLLLESGLPPCKILDFGLSRYTAKPERLTAQGAVLGTPRYMAPEVLAENGRIDERADVFAIGAVAFEMFTGRSIYPADDFGQLFGCILEGRVLSLRTIRPDASPALEQVLAEALAKDLDRRIPTVNELARRLASAIGVPEDRRRFLPPAERPVPEPTSGVRDTARDLAPLRQPGVGRPGVGQPGVGQPGVAPQRVAQPRVAQPRAHPEPRAVAEPSAPPEPRAAPAARPMPPPRPPPTPAPAALAGHPGAPPPVSAPALLAAQAPVVAAYEPAHAPTTGSFAAPPVAQRHPGVAPPASFTQPDRPARGRADGSPSMLVWGAIFVVAALVTMAAAGALAYAVRLWLATG